MLGLRFATRHPERVGALALSSCVGWLDANSRTRIERWITMLQSGEWEGFLDSAFASLWPTRSPALLRSFGAMLLGLATPNDTSRMRWLLGQLRDHDMRSELGGLGLPVLVTGGREDRIFPLVLQQQMAACIPGATSVWQPHFGHGNDFENPAHATLIAAFGRMHIPRAVDRDHASVA